MAEKEVMLMKGNEAIAHAAIRCGADGYFGYPITPQSEVIETLAELKPWETTGIAGRERGGINKYGLWWCCCGQTCVDIFIVAWCGTYAGGYCLYGWC